MNGATMLSQVEQLPSLVRDGFDALDQRVRLAINHHDLLSTKRVVLTGSGDSCFAALAAELAFEALAETACEPIAALQFARYGARYQPKQFPRNPLLIGVSALGTSSRTVEALQSGRAEGALCVALTGVIDGPVARAADAVIDTRVPGTQSGPGVRTYAASLLALQLLAIRLREVRDLVSQEQANQLRRELKQGAIHGLDSTLAALREPVRAAAAQLRDAHSLMTVGAGPHLGTALFSAAKMSEACGLNASGHDVEEWRHVQYYVSSIPSLPTVLFATGGAADDRVAEVAEAARRVGRFVIMVAPANATGAAAAAMTHAQRVLPVSCALPEALSPLVYLLPGALLAAELCVARGDRPFNGFAGPYAPNAPNAPRTT